MVQSGCTPCELPKKDQDDAKSAADKTSDKTATEMPSVGGPVKELKDQPTAETPVAEPPVVEPPAAKENKENSTPEEPIQTPPEPPKVEPTATSATEVMPEENTLQNTSTPATDTSTAAPATSGDLTEIPTPQWLPKPIENPDGRGRRSGRHESLHREDSRNRTEDRDGSDPRRNFQDGKSRRAKQAAKTMKARKMK